MFKLDDSDDSDPDDLEKNGMWYVSPSGNILPARKHSEQPKYKFRPEDIELHDGCSFFDGSKTYGVVQQGKIKATGMIVAIKAVRISDMMTKDKLLKEVKSLAVAQSCPNLITCYGSYASKANVHVLLELMDLGSLRNLCTKCREGVPEAQLAYISTASILGLQFLHDRHIMHKDIRPENILHNSAGEVKLTDFGISARDDMVQARMNQPIYMAPEMCMGEGFNFLIDIWSYGVVLYELATGRFPFPPLASFPELFQAICEDPEPRLDEGRFSPALCEFCAHCLTRELSQRGDTLHLLKHPFVGGNEASVITLHQDGDDWICAQSSGNEVASVPFEMPYEEICNILEPILQTRSVVLLDDSGEVVHQQVLAQVHLLPQQETFAAFLACL